MAAISTINTGIGSTPSKSDSILIVGAGVFGLTTALELHNRGYRNITVLDRFFPPVPDGSSVDISRVIRADYADPFYSRVVNEAMQGWKTEYKDHFYQAGLISLADKKGSVFLDRSKDVLKAQGNKIVEYSEGDKIQKDFPQFLSGHDNWSEMYGYYNPSSGWANAQGAIGTLAKKCTLVGISFCTGPQGTVTELVKLGNRIVGVKVLNGSTISGDQVILATGAWTSQLADMRNATISVSQPVGYIQLTPEEARSLKGMPVAIDFNTGCYIFPPTPETHVLKVARHGYGYEGANKSNQECYLAPRRDGDHSKSGYIPGDADTGLREGLAALLPRFKDHPWLTRRLCWYTDTPKGDFIVDRHPEIEGLFFATGGSGHGFKFLPVLGRYIVDCFQNVAPAELRQKWAWKPSDHMFKGDGSRGGPSRRLLTKEERARL